MAYPHEIGLIVWECRLEMYSLLNLIISVVYSPQYTNSIFASLSKVINLTLATSYEGDTNESSL